MSRDNVRFALPTIPQFVFECFDKMVTANWDGNKAVVEFSEIYDTVKAMARAQGQEFRSSWLQVEAHYAAAPGEKKWKVEFREDGRGGYGEDGHKYYIFK